MYSEEKAEGQEGKLKAHTDFSTECLWEYTAACNLTLSTRIMTKICPIYTFNSSLGTVWLCLLALHGRPWCTRAICTSMGHVIRLVVYASLYKCHLTIFLKLKMSCTKSDSQNGSPKCFRHDKIMTEYQNKTILRFGKISSAPVPSKCWKRALNEACNRWLFALLEHCNYAYKTHSIYKQQ